MVVGVLSGYACKRVVSAAASPPTGSPPQYSPALLWVTTGFGMGPGGARTLSATDTTLSPAQGFTPLNSFKMEWVLLCVCIGMVGWSWCVKRFARLPHACADGAGGVGVLWVSCGVGWGSTLGHEHGSAPVCYQPSTPRLSTRSSPWGLSPYGWGDSSGSGIPA